ncbi:unnamed protein product [Adineta ricciae]|uniref:Uncharacterized protein n=1 Tax=Adineta ricciae TaxID=249248 RepID=A0A815WC31_ADIRI|nr:unnamed protein product [Adineta ricciae]
MRVSLDERCLCFRFFKGFYRVYTNTDEAELLIAYGLNYVKSQGSLPIISDYFNYVQSSRFFVARERCEFISRLLNSNVVATKGTLKHDYNIKTLGKRKHLKEVVLPTDKPSSATVIEKKFVRSQSSSSERSQSSAYERAISSFAKKQKTSKSIKKQKQQQKVKARVEKAVAISELHTISSWDATDTINKKNSTPEKTNKSNTNRLPMINRSTPIINRLRTKPNGRNDATSSSSVLSSSHVVATNTKSKNKQTAYSNKRSHLSDDENSPPSQGSSTLATAKSTKSKNCDKKSKRVKY